MPTGCFNIQIDQGSTYSQNLTLTDSALIPINLSGYAARGAIRRRFSSTGVLANFTTAIISAPSGVISISLTDDETKLLPSSLLGYDIEIYTSGDAIVDRILNGKVEVFPEYTR
jgi:hypothetical protein